MITMLMSVANLSREDALEKVKKTLPVHPFDSAIVDLKVS